MSFVVELEGFVFFMRSNINEEFVNLHREMCSSKVTSELVWVPSSFSDTQ